MCARARARVCMCVRARVRACVGARERIGNARTKGGKKKRKKEEKIEERSGRPADTQPYPV